MKRHPQTGYIFLFVIQATAAGSISYNETVTDEAARPTAMDSSAKADTIPVNATTSVPPSKRAVETLFWHDIAIYNWHTRINIQQAISSQWQLAVTENFVSTLQREPRPSGAQPDRWKDEQSAQVVLRRAPWVGAHLLAGWQWQLAMDSKIFRDDFSRLNVDTRNNDFSLSGAYSRLERNFRNNLWLSGQAGYRLEQLLGRKDHGPNMKLNVALAPTRWQDYDHRFEADAEITKLPDRRNDDVRLSYGLSRQFENETSDSLFLHFAHLRRENYFADIDTLYIDLLNRDRRALENRLDYRISPSWRFSLRTEMGESKVDVSRRILQRKVNEFRHTDFEVRHNAELRWQRPHLSNDLTLQFVSQSIDYELSEQETASPLLRRYPGLGYDSKDWYLMLSHRLRWAKARDSLRWYGNAARYAHDTDNSKNPDNFDRLTVQASLLYGHRFSTTFLLQWEAYAYLEHHVYLKSSHSAGNNWRRVLKLQPNFVFDLAPGLYFKQSFGVLAQYIVYDFPEPLSRGQDNVFRNFFVIDSLSLRLNSRTLCIVQYRLRLEERGLLDWENWRQRPWFDRNEHWLSIVFDHRPAIFWQFMPGVAYLRQSDWSYRISPVEGLRRYRSGGQTIVSPTLSVRYVRSPRVVLIFSGRRQMVFRHLSKSSSIDSFRLTVQWLI